MRSESPKDLFAQGHIEIRSALPFKSLYSLLSKLPPGTVVLGSGFQPLPPLGLLWTPVVPWTSHRNPKSIPI